MLGRGTVAVGVSKGVRESRGEAVGGELDKGVTLPPPPPLLLEEVELGKGVTLPPPPPPPPSPLEADAIAVGVTKGETEEEGRGVPLPPPPPPPELEEGVKVGRAEGESTGDPVGFKGVAVGGATLPLPPPEVEE